MLGAVNTGKASNDAGFGTAMHVEHGFGPVWDASSRVLVLGSMPSPKSREMRFYYGHPLNRFWPVMAAIFDDWSCLTEAQRERMMGEGMPLPSGSRNAAEANEADDAPDDAGAFGSTDIASTCVVGSSSTGVDALVAARRGFALRHHVALWDVIAACDITGASDASIRNAEPNDLPAVIAPSAIRHVFTTGAKAAQLYRRLCEPRLQAAGLTDLPMTQLPSTSPANAAMRLPRLVKAYRVIANVVSGEDS